MHLINVVLEKKLRSSSKIVVIFEKDFVTSISMHEIQTKKKFEIELRKNNVYYAWKLKWFLCLPRESKISSNVTSNYDFF